MGWGQSLLAVDNFDHWDLQQDIADLKRDITTAALRDSNQSQEVTIQKLVAENAELKLYLTALTRLFIKKGHISRDELLAVVNAVDKEDGRLDRQFTGKIV